MTPWTSIRFAQSASRHGIEHERSRYVIRHAPCTFPIPPSVDPRWDVERVLFVGDDQRGVPLEVVAIELEDDSLLVIHAMRLRRSYRGLYAQAMRALQDDTR